MYNTIPNVQIRDVALSDKDKYGYNNRICAFGAFKNTDKGMYVLKNARTAREIYGESTSSEDFADKYFDLLFSKNNEILIYNTNYGKETASNEITVEDIADMQEELTYDKFDILLPLDNIPVTIKTDETVEFNSLIIALQVMQDHYYHNHDKCFGIIAGFDLEGVRLDHLNSFKELFSKHGIYKAVCTPLQVGSNDYDICANAVYNAVSTFNKPINRSETMTLYDDSVNGIITQEHYKSLNVQTLIDYGFLTTQYFDRGEQTVQIISNITPTGNDMRIDRAFDYIINRINFAKILGMDNNRISYDVLDSIIKYERSTAISNNLCTDIQYKIEKTDVDEVSVIITVYFNDIVRTVIANVNLIIE